MPTRHDENDGSDIFWPGYVDATTNLILNLLFLLTILIVAVFMFALELGRTSPVTSIKQDSEAVSTATAEFSDAVSAATAEFSDAVSAVPAEFSDAVSAVPAGSLAVESTATAEFSDAVSMAMNEFSDAVSMAINDSTQENIVLKSEIQRLNIMLAQQAPENEQSDGLVTTVDATASVPKPHNGLNKVLASDFEILVRFKAEAVAFTSAEHDRLLESLKPIDTSGKASIYVEVPAGFSEAKRMGFYRAMAVRNLLIEMKLPPENIDVSVVEGTSNSNASLVRVRSH
jgi:hypothetical protein